MARKEDHSREVPQVRELSTSAGGSKKIHWDDSAMRSYYPNAFDMSFDREKISLLFGLQHAGDRRYSGEAVDLSNRIVLSPLTAKRLANALESVIQQHKVRYGSPEMKSLPSAGQAQAVEPHTKGPFTGKKGADERAGLLFQLMKNLNAEVGLERSFKIANADLLQNRFLLGVSKEAVGQRADDRLTETCSLMGMPKTLLDIFKYYLPQGNYIHFGFEQNEKTTVYKVYLEFWETIEKEIRKSKHRPGPALLHLGLKWDVSDPARQALTRYTWYPWLSSQEILERVSHTLESGRGEAARQAAEQLVSLALARIPDRDILYLEVTEEGNPRRSFDINVYRANLQLVEVYPLLSMLCRRHSIPFDTFHSLYDRIKTKRLGHLAAGVDREGNSFFTVYYGVEGTFGDSSGEALLSDEGAVVSAKYSLPARRRRIIRVEETDDKASHLFRLVKDLGLGAAFERSFKFLDRILLTDRFLLGFKRPASATGRDDAIMNVCRQIDMPEDYREMFRAELHEANIVLFGFEKNEKNRVYKAYLEFNERLRQAVEQDSMPESVVLHTGFKWDVSDHSKKVVTQYRAFHVLRAEDMAARLLRGFYGNTGGNPYPIVDDMLDLAGTRTQPGELLYLEVSEGNNLRRSFDINMYLADLQMAEVYPLLVDMARLYSISLEQFEELYEAVKIYKFGHLAGGTDREGKSFLTVYFSEKGSSRRIVDRGHRISF